MPHVNFDQYEAEALDHLAEHYDKVGQFLEIEDFYKHDEVGHELVMQTIKRFARYELIHFQTRESIEIYPQVIDVVAQLRGETEAKNEPEPSVNYHVHGNNARLNVNSVDNSTNTVAIDNSVFNDICELINSQINDPLDQELLLKLVAEMKDSAGTSTFLEKYKEFIAAAANHMSVIAPALPALTTMLV